MSTLTNYLLGEIFETAFHERVELEDVEAVVVEQLQHEEPVAAASVEHELVSVVNPKPLARGILALLKS